jgi:drug/metabolite transporter (DMT)-like permease
MSNNRSSTLLLAVVACLLWSTAFVGVKVGLKYAGPLAFAGQRFMLSGFLLLPFWWLRRPSCRMACGHAGMILSIALFQTFILYGLFYFGMTLIPGALAAMVIGASPLVTAVLAHYCMAGDRLSPRKGGSLLLGLGGVAVLSLSRQPWVSATGLAEVAGIGILLLANVAGALGNILVARHKAELDPVFLNSAQLFIGGLGLWLLSLPLEAPLPAHLPWPYFAALGWLAFLSAAAFSIWFILLRRPEVQVSELNLWKFLIPVCGALLSWLLLPEEGPSLWPVVGMLCIAAAIIIYNLPGLRRFGARL